MQLARTLAVVMIATLFLTVLGYGAEFKIDDDGMAVVDGHRTFILGLYENPEDDDVLNGAVEAGFNLVRAAASKESLDRLHATGVWAWLNIGYDIDISGEADVKLSRLKKTVNEFAAHPGLLVWEVPDEALWNVWHQAHAWRLEKEPKEQHTAIDTLKDTTLATKLKVDLDEAMRLYACGRFADGEALADSIWTALGKNIPKPDFGVSNASEQAAKLGAGMLKGYRALRQLDSSHPVWMNHAPRNTIEDLAYFNRAADIVGCDIYPVPTTDYVGHSDLANRTLSCVGAYTDRMQATAPGKPVWMVLQGAGWGDFGTHDSEEMRKFLRRPNKKETRFMAYDAIVHGARGILYWGTHSVEKDSTFWGELLNVIKELDELQRVLSAADGVPPRFTLGPTNGSLDRSVIVRTKAAEDGDWHIIVNEWGGPLLVKLQLPASKRTTYRALEDDTVLSAEDDGVSLHIPGYSVVVLRPAGG